MYIAGFELKVNERSRAHNSNGKLCAFSSDTAYEESSSEVENMQESIAKVNIDKQTSRMCNRNDCSRIPAIESEESLVTCKTNCEAEDQMVLDDRTNCHNRVTGKYKYQPEQSLTKDAAMHIAPFRTQASDSILLPRIGNDETMVKSPIDETEVKTEYAFEPTAICPDSGGKSEQ